MNDLYAIGSSGLRAYQGALASVSDNIANAQTAGYARRTVSLKEHGVTAGGVAGSGVYVAGVVRTADAARAADVRRAGADLARTDTAVQWMEEIESTLSAQDIGARLTGFYNAATTLAADPSASTPRSQLLESASGVAYAFTQAGTGLARLSAQLGDQATQAVATLNGLAGTLARINDGLTRSQPGTSAQALLLDQRDQTLEQMGAIVDAPATLDDYGRATVRLGGGTGPVLVAPGGGAGTVDYARGADGSFAFAVSRGADTFALAPAGGTLAGIGDSAQRIAEARTTLGQLAGDFAARANDFQAAGEDLDGNPGAALFALDADDPTALTVALADPRGIAAASPGGGTRDNGNLAALAARRAGDGFEARATALVGQNATALQAARTVSAAQTAIHDGAVARYDATAGVDLDSEAVELMRFQQAYQGCARVIQVGRECFQSLIESV